MYFNSVWYNKMKCVYGCVEHYRLTQRTDAFLPNAQMKHNRLIQSTDMFLTKDRGCVLKITTTTNNNWHQNTLNNRLKPITDDRE